MSDFDFIEFMAGPVTETLQKLNGRSDAADIDLRDVPLDSTFDTLKESHNAVCNDVYGLVGCLVILAQSLPRIAKPLGTKPIDLVEYVRKSFKLPDGCATGLYPQAAVEAAVQRIAVALAPEQSGPQV